MIVLENFTFSRPKSYYFAPYSVQQESKISSDMGAFFNPMFADCVHANISIMFIILNVKIFFHQIEAIFRRMRLK